MGWECHWVWRNVCFSYRHFTCPVTPCPPRARLIFGKAATRTGPLCGGFALGRCCPVLVAALPLCDDVVTYGSTLANLRGFLISTGAEVVAATAIGAAYGSTKLAPELNLIVNLRRRYGQELEKCTETLGFGSDCLTAREAHFLAGMRTIERVRDCLAQRVGSTNRSRSIRI